MKINSKFIRPQVVRCILLVSALVVSRHAPAQTLTITNTTSGGSTSFQIGDGVYLAITGASAGFPVTYTDNVDYTGENFVPYAAGNVPPNGVYEFTGTAQSSNVGHHEQKWFVGGVQVAPTLVFLVYGGCPTIQRSNPPRLSWNPATWWYPGSLSLGDVTAGVNSWNAATSMVSFEYGQPIDVMISDGTLPNYTIGQVTIWNNQNGGSPCYLHPAESCPSVCMNASRIYWADMKLDAQQIRNFPLSTPDVHFFTQEVVAHEFGHVLGLTEPTQTAECADTTIMSYSEGLNCNFNTPQQCDVNAVQAIYAGWTTYAYESCGPSCNSSQSCN